MFAAIRKQMKRNRRRTKKLKLWANNIFAWCLAGPQFHSASAWYSLLAWVSNARSMSALRTSAGLSGVLEIKRFLDETLCNFLCDTVFFCGYQSAVCAWVRSDMFSRLDPFYIMFLSERSAHALKTRWAHNDEGFTNFPGDWDFPTALALARGPQNPLPVLLKSRLHVRLQKHQKPMRCLGNCWTARERSARRAKLPLQTHVACTPTGRLQIFTFFTFKSRKHQSQHVTTCHNMSQHVTTFLYLSCFRCPLCQGRVCRSGVPEEHDWWVIPAQMRLRP